MTSMRGVMFMAGLVLATVAGCPPYEQKQNTVHVQGSVTIGGAQIPSDAQANITFMPTSANQANGVSADIVKGKFDATSVPKGKVLVSFVVMQPTGMMGKFEKEAREQMQMRDLVPAAKANGQEMDIPNDNLNLNFDL